MKKILIIISLLIVSIFIILYAILDDSDEKKGALLIDKIETFRQIEKRLPDNITELGLEEPMNRGPYYEKKDSVNYIIWFGTTLGEGIYYYSDTKQWEDRLRKMKNND
jgi:hypothetical protein